MWRHRSSAVTGRIGAISRATLDPYTAQTVYDLPGNFTVFAGPREDGFYCDIPGIFDLLDGRILDNDGDPNDGVLLAQASAPMVGQHTNRAARRLRVARPVKTAGVCGQHWG